MSTLPSSARPSGASRRSTAARICAARPSSASRYKRVLRDALVSEVEYFRLWRSRATASERAMVREKRPKLSKKCERYKNFENPSNFIFIMHVPATPGKTKGMTSSTFAKSSNHDQLTITHRFLSTY